MNAKHFMKSIWMVTAVFLLVSCSVALISCEKEEVEPVDTSLSILSFTPTSGSEGTVVTITGTNFSAIAADNTVFFNGTEAVVSAATATTLTASVPDGASTGQITVAVDGITASSDSDFTVTTTASANCDEATGTVARIVCLANEFIASLSSTQASTVQLDFTASNAVRWSNLPGGVSIRNGLEFSDLSDVQLTLAKAVIEAAAGTGDNQGYDEFLQVNAADDYLSNQTGSGGGPGGAGGYSSDLYIIAFLGIPSTTGTWMLQFGGHHYAQNITFEAGEITGSSPSHQGVEPLTWTANGTTYAPLTDEHDAMAAMLAGLSASELSAAKISSSFSDVVLGPGSDGEFPATKVGLNAAGLTTTQKTLLLAAIEAWVGDIEDAAAANLMGIYESELDNTYIAYSGNASLTNHADYVRIDGPSVWIEFICQNGVVLSGIHYHTVYRDHIRDYGGNFSF